MEWCGWTRTDEEGAYRLDVAGTAARELLGVAR